jgi:hypothetical protein
MTETPIRDSLAKRRRILYDTLLTADLSLDSHDPLERQIRGILEQALSKLERPTPEIIRRS